VLDGQSRCSHGGGDRRIELRRARSWLSPCVRFCRIERIAWMQIYATSRMLISRLELAIFRGDRRQAAVMLPGGRIDADWALVSR
jgi:hypothetical protein